MIKHVNNENFEKEVLGSNKLVLVDFYADWCGPCKMLAPILEKIASENMESDIVKINVDDNQELAIKYSVMSIPTIIIFQNGQIVDKMIGFSDEKTITDLLKKHHN